jgi:hypothetical protein
MATMMRQAILIGFALWVTNDSEPPYQRGTFDSYEDCFAAGRSQVDTMAQMSPDISWQCLPENGEQSTAPAQPPLDDAAR